MTAASDSQLEKLQRLDHDTLIRVETVLNSLIIELRQTNATAVAAVADHEARIRVLEKVSDTFSANGTNSDKGRAFVFTVLGVFAAGLTAYATYLSGRH
jgi:hypothetical protein